VPLQNAIRVRNGECHVTSILVFCMNQQGRRSNGPVTRGSPETREVQSDGEIDTVAVASWIYSFLRKARMQRLSQGILRFNGRSRTFVKVSCETEDDAPSSRRGDAIATADPAAERHSCGRPGRSTHSPSSCAWRHQSRHRHVDPRTGPSYLAVAR
jgi:hypothetical protein